MDFEDMLFEVADDHVATVTLNRRNVTGTFGRNGDRPRIHGTKRDDPTRVLTERGHRGGNWLRHGSRFR